MTTKIARLTPLSLLAAGALALTSCATAIPTEQFCDDPIIVKCTGGNAELNITIDESAVDEDVLDLAERYYATIFENEPERTRLSVESSEPVKLNAGVPPRPKWELTLPVGEFADVKPTLVGVLAAAAVPGALGVSAFDGWPRVTVGTLQQFDDVFAQVSAIPLFQSGGTYTLLSPEQRLRIVHVPERTTDLAIDEIIAVARDYPNAEVLLEASESGPQFPTFYVSGLTPEEATELDSRLREPRLAKADVDGYALEFVLGSLGTDGTTYLTGTFGDVPSD